MPPFHTTSPAALAACLALHATCALSTEHAESEYDATVRVGGKRNALATARDIKRDKAEIVDSIVAEDVAKLPDHSVTDAIQRITGVQVARDRGDGTNVAIRGLTQMETTLNGREIFTAGNGRNLEFADVPAEMLAGIDVYKTSSAHHLEGGVGGLVDLRTRRPFDFRQAQAAATVRGIRGDLAGKRKTQFSLLLSDRWKPAAGEFGALLSLSLQDRAWREDQKSTGSPVLRNVGGQDLVLLNGLTETTSTGTRRRSGGNFVLQWRPTDRLDFHAEASHAELLTIQNSYQFTASGSGAGVAAGSTAQSYTWTNAAFTTVGAARDTLDRTTQIAVGGSWTTPQLTLKGDLSYTKSHNNLLYSAITLNGTAPTLSQNLSGSIPASGIGGVDPLAFGSYATAGMWYASRPFDGDLKAFRLDAEYRLAGDVLDALSAGVRIARRHATDKPGQLSFFPATVAAANAAAMAIANPTTGFFPGTAGIGGFLVGDPAQARDAEALRRALGIGAAIPTDNPLGTWVIDERTRSAYLMATIRAVHLDVAGNAGVRIIRTDEGVSGFQTVPAGGTAPIAGADSYIDILPSANLRYEIAPGLYLRGAASKTLTRPDFNQMSPSLTLNVVQLTGTAGNPALRPIRADNVDIAIERYFGNSGSIHFTAFSKRVDGFIVNRSAPEVIAGVTYQTTRPRNAGKADVTGAEIGYQQFFAALPGFGLQANYTRVDSSTFDTTLGRHVPLQNLSKHSLNLIGMYERGRVSARAAWNWRDKFLAAIGNYAGVGPVATYARAYGWLDASFSYRWSDQVTLSLEGTNLLRTLRTSYWGDASRPASAWMNDRQFVAAATLRF